MLSGGHVGKEKVEDYEERVRLSGEEEVDCIGGCVCRRGKEVVVY